jgi:hypothetical protein
VQPLKASNCEWITFSSSWDPDLVRFGGRIAKLLESKKTLQHDYAIAVLDDLLGAVYALVLALHNEPPFKDRPPGQKIEIAPLIARANGLAEHRIRLSGTWMAGYHFNSAIFRLSSVYNRSLKVVTGQIDKQGGIGNRDDPNSLISLAKDIYKKWTSNEWKDENIGNVHDRVNELKHKTVGFYWSRNVSETEAVRALEELLILLEAWDSHF